MVPKLNGEFHAVAVVEEEEHNLPTTRTPRRATPCWPMAALALLLTALASTAGLQLVRSSLTVRPAPASPSPPSLHGNVQLADDTSTSVPALTSAPTPALWPPPSPPPPPSSPPPSPSAPSLPPPPPPPCIDGSDKDTKKCAEKRSEGACDREYVAHACRRTCGLCHVPPSPPPPREDGVALVRQRARVAALNARFAAGSAAHCAQHVATEGLSAAGVLVSQVEAADGQLDTAAQGAEIWVPPEETARRDLSDRIAASFINAQVRGLYYGSRFHRPAGGIIFAADASLALLFCA